MNSCGLVLRRDSEGLLARGYVCHLRPASDISYDISVWEFEGIQHDELRILAFRSPGLAWLRDDGPIGQIFWSRRGQARATVFADGGARARLRADEAARGALG